MALGSENPTKHKGPGADQPLDKDVDPNLSVIQAVRRYREEAEEAKWDRLAKNKRNRDIYLGIQDWSHKVEGQSREFIPKAPVAIEQMCAFIKKGLIAFGDWFSIELDRSLSLVVDGAQVREVLKCFLQDLWMENNQTTTFPVVLSDSVKTALMEALIILKVHGGMMIRRKPTFKPASRATKEDEELSFEDEKVWRLRIDIVNPEDYYPDPTGKGLYEIHRVEKDLHEVIEAAEDGLYDEKAVEELIGTDFTRPEDEKRKDRARNQPEAKKPSFRKKVVLDEFWGTLLNEDGTVAHRNVVCTVANDKYLIRPPEPNPFWHQESPFVVAPIIRVPKSVWHKALYDHGSDLNIAINELFNLILDGGLAAVWGIKQLRLEDLEDPGQVAGGVRQGVTLGVKQTLPHNAKVLETVSTANVPNEAMAVFEALVREFNNAVLTNEMKVGQLPPRRVLATEVVEVTQSQAVTLDGIVADLETCTIKPLLRKAFLTILQNADDIPQHAWNSIIDARVAMLVMRASPEERYALFAEKCQFKVFGLSQTLARAQDFQKAIALMQVVMQNPMLARAFMMRYSAEKHLRRLMHFLNINPDDMEKDQEELMQVQQEMQETAAIGQAMGGAPNGAAAPKGTESQPGNAGSPEAAAVNQIANPMTGMPANA